MNENFESTPVGTKAEEYRARLKKTLLEGLDERMQRILGIVLDNTFRDIVAFTHGGTFNSLRHIAKKHPHLAERIESLITEIDDDLRFDDVGTRVVIPVLRRALPCLLAHELIGVQAFTKQVQNLIYDGGKELTLEIHTRRLSARWTMEASIDAEKAYGIDIEAELLAVIAQEVCFEIDQEILRCLRQSITPALVFKPDFDELSDDLARYIETEANSLGKSKCWAVVSPSIFTYLVATGAGEIASEPGARYPKGIMGWKHFEHEDPILIYADSLAKDDTPVLIGYKNNDEDASAYYAPYVPVMTMGPVIDPVTFEPVVSFLTRYAYAEPTKDSVRLIGIDSQLL